MSSQSSNNNMSRSTSQNTACLDPLDALIDFSGGEYDNMTYNSPSISPSSTTKTQFARPAAAPTANNAMLSSSQQPMSGPSHQYDMYKQQTGIPSGALAATHALNQQNGMFNNYSGFSNNFDNIENFNDFKPNQGYNMGLDLDLDMDFNPSPSTEPAFFYPEQALASQQGFVNPSAIQEQTMPAPAVLPTQVSNVGRLWPGMHQQQAALAKAQAQQKQQQQLIQQQRQNSMSQQPKHQKSKSQSADPIVEEKISQLLNSMRQSSVAMSEGDDTAQNMTHSQRMRKDEEDMDEDERLLASEEGKKLSSKERRQLRNKVSARAFRSRRKEYIGQLEGEIATKVNENSDLRAQNRALMEENTRLSDLTRMLLSSPSFSGFLDNLSQNPTAVPAQPKIEQQQAQPNRQVRKDVNPYASQQTQMHMAMIPEQPIDFSALDLSADAYAYQPQVFSVLSVPEPTFDASILSGKTSNFVGKFRSEDDKVEMPVIERLPIKQKTVTETTPAVDEEFDADPAFALYNELPAPQTSSPLELSALFGGIAPEKALARLVLVDAKDVTAAAELAMVKVERICASMDSVMERLEAMTIDL